MNHKRGRARLVAASALTILCGLSGPTWWAVALAGLAALAAFAWAVTQLAGVDDDPAAYAGEDTP